MVEGERDDRNDRGRDSSRRDFLLGVGGLGISCPLMAVLGTQLFADGDPVSCAIYPAEPPLLAARKPYKCTARSTKDKIFLANGCLEAQVSAETGVITRLKNKLTGQTFEIQGDQVGFALMEEKGELEGKQGPDRKATAWYARAGEKQVFQVSVVSDASGATAELRHRTGGLDIGLVYQLRDSDFWIERQLTLESATELNLDSLDYGRALVPDSNPRELELGKFDRPALLAVGKEGVFTGVGWWFYTVTRDRIYRNSEMQYRSGSKFESEPWYLGVFVAEEGEPYAGWLWYKQFLQQRKLAADSLPFSACWNAGFGQWGIDIDSPAVVDFVPLVAGLGIRQIGFGGGLRHPAIAEYVALIRSSPLARSNLELCRKHGLSVGFLEHGGLKEKWEDNQVIEDKLKVLDEFRTLGFGTFHFDYFSTVDTFTAHRNITRYFRAVHEKLDYVECHLGMAAYGPQFQREVLLNHPTDLEGFDISHFSTDWTTFLGFRHSRRQWQLKYQYLMPEYSLYYYATHYANWGHPRLYTDPEPQQLFYKYETYCGIGYDFHDQFGFRNSVAALSGFSPFYVFGYLDHRMPPDDKDFMCRFLEWARTNVDVLRSSRICFEDEKTCVISKIRQDKGALYLLNYDRSARRFDLELALPDGSTIRQVFPAAEKAQEVGPGVHRVRVPAESVVILEVNGAFTGLPPSNTAATEDVSGWRRSKDGWMGGFDGQAVRRTRQSNDVPLEILSIEATRPTDPIVTGYGRGALPARFLKVFDVKDGARVETWKIAPWALRDRIWLVYVPVTPWPWEAPYPALKVNGTEVRLVPRLDYRPKAMTDWTCPVFFADVTEAVRARRNQVHVRLPAGGPIGRAYVVWKVA